MGKDDHLVIDLGTAPPPVEACEHPDVLPESRMKRRIGGIRGPDGTYVPIFCANCGAKCGMVPESFITHTFSVCDPCSFKHGTIAHTYQEPDHVFWKRVTEAQLETHGRLLTVGELTIALNDPTTVESKLADEWRAHVRKAG